MTLVLQEGGEIIENGLNSLHVSFFPPTFTVAIVKHNPTIDSPDLSTFDHQLRTINDGLSTSSP